MTINEIDELRKFVLSSRVIIPKGASLSKVLGDAYRTFSNARTVADNAIKKLLNHLEDEQRSYFNEKRVQEAVQEMKTAKEQYDIMSSLTQ